MRNYEVLKRIKEEGGLPLFCGGFVRDFLRGETPKDIDVEVYGLPYDVLLSLLTECGQVSEIGKSFGIIRYKDVQGEFDFSLPRKDSKLGPRHKDYLVEYDPYLSKKDACARRDYTINSMLLDPFSGDLFDCYSGRADLKDGVLRMTSQSFRDDSLRVLRGFQLCSRFDLIVEEETARTCEDMCFEYNDLPLDRIWQEWKKFLLLGKFPTKGIKFLVDSKWIKFYPELQALVGVNQNPKWHPESYLRRISSFPLKTSMTQASSTNKSLRQLLSSSSTGLTRIPFFSRTSHTKTIVDSIFRSFSTAARTGSFSKEFSSFSSPTIITEAEGFVWLIRGKTTTTDKIVRIVFQISLSCVHALMQTCVDDFQILNRIIKFVSVFMVDVFVPTQISSDMKLHDNSMNTDSATALWATGIQIPAGICVDTRSSSVDGNVKFILDYCIGNVYHDTISPKKFIDYNPCEYTPNLGVYEIHNGDALDHTGFVCDAGQEISTRENLSEDDRLILMSACCTHDLGKATHSQGIFPSITSRGHDQSGVPLSDSFLYRIGAPNLLHYHVPKLVGEHMAYLSAQSGKAVKKLAERLEPSNLYMLSLLIESDFSGREPLPKGLPDKAKRMLEFAKQENVVHRKPVRLLEGRHLKEIGLTPSPLFGKIIADSYKKQLDGTIRTLEEALQFAKERS